MKVIARDTWRSAVFNSEILKTPSATLDNLHNHLAGSSIRDKQCDFVCDQDFFDALVAQLGEAISKDAPVYRGVQIVIS